MLEWTDGRASSRPAAPAGTSSSAAGDATIGQANNVFIFPGMGLGAIVAQAREMTDEAFLVAARTLAGWSRTSRWPTARSTRRSATLRPVARDDREALVVHFRDAGYGRQLRDEQVADAVDRAMWRPEYLEYAAD